MYVTSSELNVKAKLKTANMHVIQTQDSEAPLWTIISSVTNPTGYLIHTHLFTYQTIKQHSKVTYLGCILDNDLSGESMATKVLRLVNNRLKFL